MTSCSNSYPEPLTVEKQKTTGFFRENQQVLMRRTNSEAVRFQSVADLNDQLKTSPDFREWYDAVTYVYVYERSRELPVAWPRAAQIIDVRFSLCRDTSLPTLPAGLRSLTLMKCSLILAFDVPAACAACPNLEEVVLYGSGVRTLHAVPVPNPPPPPQRENVSLRLLDVSCCPVHSLHVQVLPVTLSVLDLSSNLRDFSEGAYTVAPYDYASHPELRHLILQGPGRVVNPAGANTTPYRHVSTVGHNVHVRSIQDSTNASMNTLYAAYEAASRQLRRDGGGGGAADDWLGDCRRALSAIGKWSSLDALNNLDKVTVHSSHSITLYELIRRVWTIIAVHPSRDDLTHVFADELYAGKSWCFTGRFTRIVNVLSGFVEGVQVGMSPVEHMQNRLSVLWQKANALLQQQPPQQQQQSPSSASASSASQQQSRARARELFFEACGEVREAGFSKWDQAASWLEPFVDALLDERTEHARFAFSLSGCESEDEKRELANLEKDKREKRFADRPQARLIAATQNHDKGINVLSVFCAPNGDVTHLFLPERTVRDCPELLDALKQRVRLQPQQQQDHRENRECKADAALEIANEALHLFDGKDNEGDENDGVGVFCADVIVLDTTAKRVRATYVVTTQPSRSADQTDQNQANRFFFTVDFEWTRTTTCLSGCDIIADVVAPCKLFVVP